MASPSHTRTETRFFTGTVTDQTALYGLISRARDFGLTLVAIERIDVDARGGSW